MELTKKQAEGLNIAIQRYKDKEKYTVISGYAGTGKSTLVSSIVEALRGLPNGPKVFKFACYTGKAASVLTRKGNKDATTLHKMLYRSKRQPDGSFIYKPVEVINADVIIIDECSMVPISMLNLLLSHNVYILFCGDPAQLPPVKNKEANDLLNHPHVFLDEIMRQAQESNIIKLSMDIRAGKPIPNHFESSDVNIYDIRNITLEKLLMEFNKADEILVGMNTTRALTNQIMRICNHKEGPAQEGDKVICTHNSWEEFSSDENPLVNGTIGYLRNTYNSFKQYNVRAHREDDVFVPGRIVTLPYIQADFETDFGDVFPQIQVDRKLLDDGSNGLSPQDEFVISKNSRNPPLPLSFEFGYAITVHKAQGSQWDKILIINESWPYSKTEHDRWLYTAITRAVNEVVIINAPGGLDKYI